MGGNLMRTVTFANVELAAEINDSVIPVWNNQNPQLGGVNFAANLAAKQPKPTPQQIAAYPQGGGGGNMRVYFCAPSGEVFHYSQGYWSAENFSEEIEFAAKLFEEIKAKDGKLSHENIVEAIKQRVGKLQQQQSLLTSLHPGEFKKPVAQSQIRRQHAAIGLKINACNAAVKTVGQDIKAVLTQILQQNLFRGAIR